MPTKATKPKGQRKSGGRKKNSANEAFNEIESFRHVPREVLEDALSDAIEKGYRKSHDLDAARIKAVFNAEDGTVKAYRLWDVVETVEDPEYQLDVEEAKDLTPDPKVGEVLEEETDIDDFVRGDISTVKSVMLQKIKEAEKKRIIDEYSDRVGDLVDGIIHTVEERFVTVRLGATADGQLQPGATDAMMRRSDQIPTETYVEGEHIKVVITKVDKEAKGALVMVSRSDNDMIKRLYEKEVPEIYNGIIEIKAIARDAGMRAKMAVVSSRENIDPIGACIGPGGSRVRAISSELNNEKIDIFEWSDDLQKLVANALSPAQGIEIFPAEKAGDKLGNDKMRHPGRENRNNDERKVLVAAVPDSQLPLAIGKKGQNARLAYKLTGHRIDIRLQSELDDLGIDWRTYVQEMHDEYEEKKAAERAYKQQQKIDALRNSSEEAADISELDDFSYGMEYDDRHLDEIDTFASRETVEETPAAETEAVAPEAAPAENAEVRELDEMEEAARIAKEKRKSLSEKRSTTFVSKFESAAEAPKAEPAKPSKPHKAKEEPKKDDRKRERKKPTFNVLHPIYTEEELDEIENNEIEEEESRFNDDIDYEEFDSYYDEY